MPDENATEDKTLECCDCKEEFIFTAKESRFFASKGFNDPKRCKPCRDAKKQARRSQGN
ncbi:MAG: hypothetical protein GTN93_21525 [Anaerolineae bacterium]|nr:hypothetical protein [Anaerolineae bacterium]